MNLAKKITIISPKATTKFHKTVQINGDIIIIIYKNKKRLNVLN